MDGYSIFKWDKGKWNKVPGAGVRITVGPDGNAWIVDRRNHIYQYDDKSKKFIRMTGTGNDIGVGGDGTVWVIGTNREPGGFGIYRKTASVVNRWQKIPGSALEIDTDGSGNAWVVNNKNFIFQYNGKRWTRFPGQARDIGVGPDG